MENTYIAKSAVDLKASPADVWDALTNPEKVQEYFFGTHVDSDWKVGSPIIYTGEWNGKQYRDKGTILRVEKDRLLEHTYWSSMAGKEDKPENYNKVTYELEPKDGGTHLTVTQDNIPTEDAREHSQKSWEMLFQELKKFVEAQ